LSKDDSLLVGRVEPEFVGSLRLVAHGLLAFLLFFYVFLKSVDNLTISRSLVRSRNFLESLQESRVNVERKSLCLHTGGLS
jgi:hypothetical protein